MATGNKALVIGTGLGGLATALRLTSKGYRVEMVEQYHQAGGRLNVFSQDGFTFDTGPSFFSMSYEFEELFQYCGITNPLSLEPLDPVYSVYFSHHSQPFRIYKDLKLLAKEFEHLEADFEAKARHYLEVAGKIFHDTEYKVIKKNFNSVPDYLLSLTSVPWKHAPKMFRSLWTELEKHFESDEVKIVFSLVAFFLGSTPFDTPAVYSLLNYTELEHDGYWHVKGGMYEITRHILKLLEENGVKVNYNKKIVGYEQANGTITALIDQNHDRWQGDLFVVNADAAAFRGEVMEKKPYQEKKLDQMKWTLAPFTMYLGIEGKIDGLHHHNYFLGSDFKNYANTLFDSTEAPQKPYYYVNVSSKSNPASAPEGCENIFVLCPVPDRRYKPDWQDAEQLKQNIIQDLSKRTETDISSRLITESVWTPSDWQQKFNLYKGSGLGLAHHMSQIGGFRPKNKDEDFNNLYYVGASTVPGTGLPIVVISSRLTTEQILADHGAIH